MLQSLHRLRLFSPRQFALRSCWYDRGLLFQILLACPLYALVALQRVLSVLSWRYLVLSWFLSGSLHALVVLQRVLNAFQQVPVVLRWVPVVFRMQLMRSLVLLVLSAIVFQPAYIVHFYTFQNLDLPPAWRVLKGKKLIQSYKGRKHPVRG